MAEASVPQTLLQVVLAYPDKAPNGGIKWKPLYDQSNSLTNKVLLRNTHNQELLPWIGFVHHPNKDYCYTRVPLSDEQLNLINRIEEGVQALLQQNEWSSKFKMMRTEKVYPRTSDCIFFEKREDGRLYRTHPTDAEKYFKNSEEKELQIGAVLHLSGVYFDFANLNAKLTFRMVSATYKWTACAMQKESVFASYLTPFGEIVCTPSEASHDGESVDPIEAAAIMASITPPPIETSTSLTTDRESFMTALSKTRSVKGVEKRLKLVQRKTKDSIFRQWCEEEARKAIAALDMKTKKKEKKVKPIKIAKDVAGESYAVQQQQQQGPQPVLPPQHAMDIDIFSSGSDASDEE